MKEEIQAQEGTMKQEVLEGLRQSQKYLPSKYFYDERGSELFEEITELNEYYPTRTEIEILKDNIGEIKKLIGSRAMLVELGSGSSKKIRLLLKSIADLAAYVPVDISSEYLKKVALRLHRDFPDLNLKPVCADYTNHFKLPDLAIPYEKQVLFYPGSTIGNFTPVEARKFLQNLASLTDANAGMLIGVDLKKNKKVLEQAYNDRQGITAAFNKNLLVRLNRELNADFDIENFTHHARYNEEEGRVEMHLISALDQDVHIAGETFSFQIGESVHTENSYKYSLKEFQELVSDWFSVEKVWTDDHQLFSLQYLQKKEGATA